MNIITCFKVVPAEEEMVIRPDGDVSFEKAKQTISSFDLCGIEEAVRLFEIHGGSVTAISVGTKRIDESKLKKSILSHGPESLYLIADDELENLDAYQTALVLKAGIQKIGDFDLIVCGEGSADNYSQQVGIQLGQALEVPVINSVSKIDASGNRVVIERTLEDEIETLEIELPAVIAVSSDINLPRIPGMKQILAAGKKPTAVWTLNDLELTKPARTVEILETKAPKQAQRKKEIVEGDSDEAIQEFIHLITRDLG